MKNEAKSQSAKTKKKNNVKQDNPTEAYACQHQQIVHLLQTISYKATKYSK